MKLKETWRVVIDNKKATKHLTKLLVRLMSDFPKHQEAPQAQLPAPSEPPNPRMP
jgi:hypothetical protein